MITDKSKYGHDAVLDLDCGDSVQVLRTEPMTLTEQEQKIVQKYLGIALLEKSYIDANGHLMVVLSDGCTLDVGSARGLPGPVPYVGPNGNWFVEGVDTLVSAQGVQGFTPYIGPNGNWFINGTDTGKKAVATDGETPYIGANGNWWAGDRDLGVQAPSAQKLSELSSRMDSFTSLPDGSTAGDAELFDARVGYNGVVYPNVGGAVRGQIGKLSEEIDDINGVATLSVTYTNGAYVSDTGEIITYAPDSYSDLIPLKMGEMLDIKKAKSDTANKVALLCKCDSNGNAINVIHVYSAANTEENYRYKAVDTVEYLRITYTTNFGAPVVRKYPYAIPEKIEVLEEEIGAIKESIPYEQAVAVEFERNYGAYCSATQKKLVELDSYWYSDLYELRKGETITVYSKDASGSNVARISKWSSSGKTMQSVIATATTDYSTVSYTATEEIEYIRFSNNRDEFIVHKIAIAVSEIFKETVKEIARDFIEPVPYASISMFESVAFCGDSYVKGQLYNSSGLVGDRPNLAWGSCIGRMAGIESHIYASSGADTNTWQTRSDCLPMALKESAKGLYVFCMGINDATYVTLGSMADINEDYTQNPNTFYGNYGRIVEQIKSHAPSSKIIIMTPYNPSYNARYVAAVTEITKHFGIAMIDTTKSSFCSSSFFKENLVGGHPTALLHSAIANDVCKLIGNCIDANTDYFKNYTGI